MGAYCTMLKGFSYNVEPKFNVQKLFVPATLKGFKG